MAKIFLSYARDDVELAKRLAALVADAGHQVWWDREIHGGSQFSSEIDKALQDANAVVVLWTEASTKSAWVKDEAAEGRDSGRLVPVVLDGIRPPLGFRQYQSIELGKWTGAGEPQQFEALLRAIDKTGETTADACPSKPEEQPRKASKSICVLPFVNMSGDPEQEYFSDGITEDIITDLSKVSALSVVARNTAFMYKGQTIDVKDVARLQNVTHVLEGSVRKAGSRVRITAQLIDGAAGDHVWADRFDRELDDIFAIQDEISKAIVAVLRVKLLPEEKKAIETRGTASVEAYNLYLMARQQWVTGDYSDARRDETIARICQQALSFDPNYAQALALMALAHAQLRLMHGKDVDALATAERALAINPDIAEAHCVKAQLLEDEGKLDEAQVEMEEALRLDPESWEVNREAARLLFRRGRIKESIPPFEKAASLMQSDWHNPMMLTTCFQSVGDEKSLLRYARMAVERAEMAVAKDPTNAQALAGGSTALALIGEHGRARDWIERALLVDPDNIVMRYNLACSLAARLDDRGRAMEVMEPYFERAPSATLIRHLEADPDMDNIRDDPRFKNMLASAKQRLGIATAEA